MREVFHEEKKTSLNIREMGVDRECSVERKKWSVFLCPPGIFSCHVFLLQFPALNFLFFLTKLTICHFTFALSLNSSDVCLMCEDPSSLFLLQCTSSVSEAQPGGSLGFTHFAGVMLVTVSSCCPFSSLRWQQGMEHTLSVSLLTLCCALLSWEHRRLDLVCFGLEYVV